MIRLDATTKIVQYIATGTAAGIVTGLNVTTSAATGFSEEVAMTATTATLAAAPAASTVKQIDHISVKNTSGAANTITIQLYNSTGPVTSHSMYAVLQANETLEYTHAGGWQVLDATGAKRTANSAAIAGSTLAISGAASFSGTVTLAGTAANIATGANYVSYDGTDAGLSFTSSNVAVLSSSLGVGVTPSATANKTQFNLGGVGMGMTYSSLGTLHMHSNSYDVSGTQKYANTAPAGLLYLSDNTFALLNAPSGTAGTSISWTTVMQSNANGRMAINGTPTTAQLFISASASGIAVVSMESTTSSPASSDAVCTMWNKATSGDNKFLSFYTEGSATERGLIDYNRGGGVVRYNTTSDATLKNLIGDAPQDKSISILSNTRLREFAWKNDPANKPQIGVLAQELYPVFPGAVSVGGDYSIEDEDGNTVTAYRPWAVDKTAYQYHLIAGWQNHDEKINLLIAENTALKARIAALESAH